MTNQNGSKALKMLRRKARELKAAVTVTFRESDEAIFIESNRTGYFRSTALKMIDLFETAQSLEVIGYRALLLITSDMIKIDLYK